MKVKELLVETKIVLLENLTKGAENILRNVSLTAKIADQLRNDFTVPVALSRKFQRQEDQDVVRWFLGELDRMEREGADEIIYSRDGKLHAWIAQNYANGSDLWEDIEGELQDTLRDFIILRNRNMLAERHREINDYKGVKELHRYLVTHYQEALNSIKETAKSAAITKKARSIKLADNSEYMLYLLQNRGAAIIHGKGATFCTANTQSDYNWNNYSQNGAIFGLLVKGSMVAKPKAIGQIDTSTQEKVQEKYQFDAPSRSFKDNLDMQVDPKLITKRFPYLWDDLKKGLETNKAEIENPQHETNIEKKSYNVSKTLHELQSNLTNYWTGKTRPTPEEEEAIKWFEENFSVGDLVVLTNPRATPRSVFLGPSDTDNYKVQQPGGEEKLISKRRLAKSNKARHELQNNPDAEVPPDADLEEPN